MNNLKLFSLCVLECSDCPCWLAWRNDNQELRIKTAKKWAKLFGWKGLKPEEMNCTGCLSKEGSHFRHCQVCGVRQCGLDKGVENCGLCEKYDCCELIAKLHEEIVEGKEYCERLWRKCS